MAEPHNEEKPAEFRLEFYHQPDGLAAVLTDRGAFDEAQAIFTESLRVDPGDDFARNGLVLIGKRRAARSE